MDPLSRQLSSWKEVAAFLGVSVRTAQRWERERGLPVRRVDGEKGRVLAETSQLGEWKKKIATNGSWWTNPRVLQVYAAAMTGLALAACGALLVERIFSGLTGAPASTHLEFKSLIANDSRGRELWRYQFPDVLGPDAYYSEAAGRTSWIGDIDGDGRTEILFSYLPTTALKSGTALYCFSAAGKVKWRFLPGKTVSNKDAIYSRTYVITDFAVSKAAPGGGLKIVVASQHTVYYPCQIAVLNGAGGLTGEYWHSGHLDTVELGDPDGDGVEDIFLVGVNNQRQKATLVVLDPRKVRGASYEGEGNPYQILGMTRAAEKRIVRFPRTCVNRVVASYNQGKTVRVEGQSVMVRVQETRSDLHCAAFYSLDRTLRVTAVRLSDAWRNLHLQLEREGKVDHPFSPKESEALLAGSRETE